MFPPEGEFLDVEAGWSAGGEGDWTNWTWPPLKRESEWEYTLEGPYEAISSDYRHACGLRPDGSVDCWGLTGKIQRLEEAPKLKPGNRAERASHQDLSSQHFWLSASFSEDSGERVGGLWGERPRRRAGANVRRLSQVPW